MQQRSHKLICSSCCREFSTENFDTNIAIFRKLDLLPFLRKRQLTVRNPDQIYFQKVTTKTEKQLTRRKTHRLTRPHYRTPGTLQVFTITLLSVKYSQFQYRQYFQKNNMIAIKHLLNKSWIDNNKMRLYV